MTSSLGTERQKALNKLTFKYNSSVRNWQNFNLWRFSYRLYHLIVCETKMKWVTSLRVSIYLFSVLLYHHLSCKFLPWKTQMEKVKSSENSWVVSPWTVLNGFFHAVRFVYRVTETIEPCWTLAMCSIKDVAATLILKYSSCWLSNSSSISHDEPHFLY